MFCSESIFCLKFWSVLEFDVSNQFEWGKFLRMREAGKYLREIADRIGKSASTALEVWNDATKVAKLLRYWYYPLKYIVGLGLLSYNLSLMKFLPKDLGIDIVILSRTCPVGTEM